MSATLGLQTEDVIQPPPHRIRQGNRCNYFCSLPPISSPASSLLSMM
jgi:hypothetical protein